jgi:DNA polymerase
VQALVAARLGNKTTLEETRTQRLLGIADRGVIPVPLSYYAAHTGRWGGDDKVNLQNLTRGSPIKNAILAPHGYVIIDSDSSQIEARTLAWFAGQSDLVEAFRQGKDVYSMTAAAIYDVSDIYGVRAVTNEERFVGKTTVLGCGYGMGWAKFQNQLKKFGHDLPSEECKRIVDAYRTEYPKIPELWWQAQTAIEAMANNQTVPLGLDGVVHVEGKKGIRLPNGLYLKYPNLRRVTNEEGKTEYVYDVKKGKTITPNKIYGGKLIENVCQALARIIIGDQLLAIAKHYPVVLTVHDAIACLVPDNMEDKVDGLGKVMNEMRVSPRWAAGLPLNCEAGMGRSYGEC